MSLPLGSPQDQLGLHLIHTTCSHPCCIWNIWRHYRYHLVLVPKLSVFGMDERCSVEFKIGHIASLLTFSVSKRMLRNFVEHIAS
jgi:hypothetical protein